MGTVGDGDEAVEDRVSDPAAAGYPVPVNATNIASSREISKSR
jgi:hypothetical protein